MLNINNTAIQRDVLVCIVVSFFPQSPINWIQNTWFLNNMN